MMAAIKNKRALPVGKRGVCRLFGLILFMGASLTGAQESSLFPADDSFPREDSTGQYRHYVLKVNNKPETDFWIYQSAEGGVQTLHDAGKIDGSGVIHTGWKVDWEHSRFAAAYSKNIRPLARKSWTSYAREYDYGAKKIRQHYSYGQKDQLITQALFEEIPYPQTIWQKDLGLGFALFLPAMDAADLPLRLCYESYGHPVFMKIEKLGEEALDGIPCVKYKIGGEGLWSKILPQGGYAWVAQGEGGPYLVKHSMRMAFSWTMRSFSMRLMESGKMDTAEWLALQNRLIGSP